MNYIFSFIFKLGISYAFVSVENEPAEWLDEFSGKRKAKKRNRTVMNKCKCSRDFTAYTNAKVVEFAKKNVGKMTNHPTFKTPPVSMADITTQSQALSDGIVAATGDPTDTLVMINAKVLLLDSLRKNASYVESLASDNKELLQSSGFDAASTMRVAVFTKRWQRPKWRHGSCGR
jgi:hypothetical protein